jgi:ferric-dicitrate binding protein FerR (iron transport regulator)
MTARSPHDPESAASALGRLLHDSRKLRSGAASDSALERLFQAANAGAVARPSALIRHGWALAAAAIAVVALVGSVAWFHRASRELTFSANGVPAHDGTAIAADSGRGVELAFSDGSLFDVEPAARLRVESSEANGARLTLLGGKTIAHVVHRASSRWSVSAGPFEVQVTGTRFATTWDSRSERLSVELYEGSVQIVGGGFTAPIAVRAGQRLEAGKGSGNWLLTSLQGPANVAAVTKVPLANAATPSASGGPEPAASAPPGTLPSSRMAAPMLDWPTLLGRADFEGIVRQANDLGIERCLSTCASSDLRMLADSARYLGRYALAERSLLALRKRSPADAASAAFLLGRLEEPRDVHRSIAWYEKNLAEAPGGAYAAEACAGKMRALLQQGGPAAAAPAAEEYLARFPDGVYAGRARDVLAHTRTRIER